MAHAEVIKARSWMQRYKEFMKRKSEPKVNPEDIELSRAWFEKRKFPVITGAAAEAEGCYVRLTDDITFYPYQHDMSVWYMHASGNRKTRIYRDVNDVSKVQTIFMYETGQPFDFDMYIKLADLRGKIF